MNDTQFHRATGRGPFCPVCHALVQWVGRREHRISDDGNQLIQRKSIAFGQDKYYRKDNLIDLTPNDSIEPVNLMKQRYG